MSMHGQKVELIEENISSACYGRKEYDGNRVLVLGARIIVHPLLTIISNGSVLLSKCCPEMSVLSRVFQWTRTEWCSIRCWIFEIWRNVVDPGTKLKLSSCSRFHQIISHFIHDEICILACQMVWIQWIRILIETSNECKQRRHTRVYTVL